MGRFEKCGVCEDDTHSISFYGAIVCNPCRAFFRRHVLQSRVRRTDNLPLLLAVEGMEALKCRRYQQCLLSGPLRRKCGWCRFQKCLAIGMKPSMVKSSTHIFYEMKHPEICSSRSNEISSHETAFVFKSTSAPEEQQNLMCYDTSRVSSQQFYWNEDAAHITPYLWKQDLRHVTPLSWQQLPRLGPPENFWLKKPEGSSVEYTLINMMMAPASDYFMSLDVQDETLKSFYFSDTIQSSLDLPATALIMTSIQGCVVFHRHSQTHFQTYFETHSGSLPMPTIDVQVTSRNEGNSLEKQVVMKSLTEEHWKRLQEMTKAYKFWESFMNVHVEDINPTDNRKPGSHKRLFLSVTSHICSKNITQGIYSLEIIEGISLEDQVIVAKEAYFPLAALLYIHTFVRHENAFVLYSPETRHVLQMCIHIDSNRAHFSTELYDMLCRFLEVCYDFLRVDLVVMALLSLIAVYSEVPGLSCSKIFNKERSIYTELLDKYIDAKVESKQWLLSKNEIWDHIAKLMAHLPMSKPAHVNFFRRKHEAES